MGWVENPNYVFDEAALRDLLKMEAIRLIFCNSISEYGTTSSGLAYIALSLVVYYSEDPKSDSLKTENIQNPDSLESSFIMANKQNGIHIS